jgi:hypothetical protein
MGFVVSLTNHQV